MRQSRLYCLQNLVPEAEIFLTHSEVVWGVGDSVDFRKGDVYIFILYITVTVANG